MTYHTIPERIEELRAGDRTVRVEVYQSGHDLARARYGPPHTDDGEWSDGVREMAIGDGFVPFGTVLDAVGMNDAGHHRTCWIRILKGKWVLE